MVPEAYAKKRAPLNTEDLIYAQARDRLCRMFCDTVRIPGSDYNIDAKGILIRTSPLDKCVQIVAPKGMRNCIIYLAHNSVRARHPGSSQIYSTLRCSYY